MLLESREEKILFALEMLVERAFRIACLTCNLFGRGARYPFRLNDALRRIDDLLPRIHKLSPAVHYEVADSSSACSVLMASAICLSGAN